jgi:hypothetical protein
MDYITPCIWTDKKTLVNQKYNTAITYKNQELKMNTLSTYFLGQRFPSVKLLKRKDINKWNYSWQLQQTLNNEWHKLGQTRQLGFLIYIGNLEWVSIIISITFFKCESNICKTAGIRNVWWWPQQSSKTQKHSSRIQRAKMTGAKTKFNNGTSTLVLT